MDSVFGIMESPELFSPRNGIIVSQLVEKKFDKGFMAIVPLNVMPNEHGNSTIIGRLLMQLELQ